MNQNTKDWIKLVALIFGTGAVVTVTAVQGGAAPWISIVLGLGTAGSNVYHALNDKPGDRPATSPASVAENIERKTEPRTEPRP